MPAKISLIHTISGFKGPVYALAGFYAGGADGYLVRWDAETGTGLACAQFPSAIFALHEQGDQVWIGTFSGQLYRYRPGSGVEEMLRCGSAIYAIQSTGQSLWVGCKSGHLWTWDGENTWQSQAVLPGALRHLNVHRGEMWYGGSGGSWGPLEGSQCPVVHQGTISGLAMAPDRVVSSGMDAKLCLWNPSADMGWVCQQEIPAHLQGIHALALQPLQSVLLTGSLDKSIKVWDFATLTLLKVMDPSKGEMAHTRSVNALQWLDDERFVSVSDDATLKLWRWA
ncbi:MAG: WD40 repeat domain-containing protein [Bacteroidia bacterium]